MKIQVNTSSTISGSEKLDEHIRATVEAALERFAPHITRVEAHLSDQNGARDRGEDKRCVLEARPAGRDPVSVSDVAATLDQAIEGASSKMEKLLDSLFEKQRAGR